MTSASVLLARALDRAAEPGLDATSDRILDAALDLCSASGLRNLTMDDVAARAVVARMTVYRRFGDRATLVDALCMRECGRCLAELDAAIDPAGAPAEQIADGFLASMRIARTHPLLNRLAQFEPAAIIETLSADEGMILVLMREFCAARLRAAGAITGPAAEEAAEVLVRLCVSFVLIGQTVIDLDDERAARAFALRALAPLVRHDHRSEP